MPAGLPLTYAAELLAETTSREDDSPAIPTWLMLASVGVAGLEPTASRSQSGRSTKLSYAPLRRYVGIISHARVDCQM